MPVPKKKPPYRTTKLVGGIERPHVIRKQLAEEEARVAQLWQLLEISEKLEAAELDAHRRVLAEEVSE